MSRRKQANPAKLEMERGQGEKPEHIVPNKNDSGPSSAAADDQSTTDEEVQLSAAMSQLNLISLHRVMGQTSICDFSGTSAGDPSTIMAAKAATAKAAAAIGAAKTAGRSLTSAAGTAASSHGHGQSTSSASHTPKVRCATAPPIRSSTPIFGEPEVEEDLSPTSSTIQLSAASSSTDPFAISVVPSAVTITDILTETEEEYEQEIKKEPAHSSVTWHYGPKTSTPKKIIDLTRTSDIPPAEIEDVGSKANIAVIRTKEVASKANTAAYATKEVASETAQISIKPTRDIASETVFETKNIATETVNVLEAASQTFVKDYQGRRALYISASQLKMVASTAFETVEGIVRTAKSDVLSLSEGESVDLSPGTTDRSQESPPATPQEENPAEPVVKQTEELYKNVQFEKDTPQPEDATNDNTSPSAEKVNETLHTSEELTGSFQDMQWTCAKRSLTRRHSSSPTPVKKLRVDPERSLSDGETSRMEEPYECSVCFLTFSRSAALDEHMQTHTDQLQFTCSYCPRLFKHKRSRDRHTKLHTGDKKYKCQQCDSAFSRSDHLKIHMKTHDSRKPYKCGTCNRGYNTAAALSSHQQSHLKQESRSGSRNSRGSTPSPGLFRCNQCTDSFTKQELLQEHLISYHNDEDAPIRTPDRISVELKSQHDELKIICMYCSKEFPSLESMYHHVSITHRDFQNGVTSALSTQSSSLQSSPKNELCQNGTPTYACDKCTMQFESVQNLKDHLNMIHWRPILTNNLKEYNVNRAKTAGMDKSYSPFQTHPTDLSRKKCKDDYFDASAKKRKIDQHSPSMTSPYDANDKPCICSCCYAQLPNFKSFLNHMETHMASSNTSFLGFCPFCGEPGRDPVSFTNHIFGHAIAQVPGTCCYVCKKSFEHLDDLQKHFAEIHVIPIYKCSICNEIFDSKLTMQMHFTTKHNEECHHFKCYLCTNQIFHDRLSAELHISMKHYHQFVPSVNTTNQSLLTSQYQVELDKRLRDFGFLFQCTFCQECFKDQYSQYIHILKEHNDTKEGEKYLLETALNQRQTPSTSPSFLFSKSIASPDNVNKFDVKNAKSLTCDICNRSDITTEADLIAHKKIQHAKSKIRSVSLQCAYCNEYCKSRTDLENHMKSHQVNCGKGKHKCNICDEVFSSSLILADHKLTHCKIVDGNNCLQCKAVLSDEKLFYSHQLQHSNGPIRPNSQISLPANCIICCQTLQTEVEIKLHAKFHLKHLTKEFVCGICNKLCDNQNYTGVDGMSEQSRNKFTVTICKDCNRKKEGTPNISQENVKNKENEIYLQCPQYIRDNEVQDQVNLHMTSEISSNLECRLCKQIFPSPSKLQVHLIEHNFYGMNQYNCYVCSSVFTAASGLQNHIVGHGLQSKPYECSHCQMKFFFRSELDNHRFIHLNSPQQKCETPKSHLQSNGTDLYENRSSPQYKTCKYCSSSYLNNSFFTEHLTQCPFRVDLKQECYDVDIESTIKKEVADSSQEFINEEQ